MQVANRLILRQLCSSTCIKGKTKTKHHIIWVRFFFHKGKRALEKKNHKTVFTSSYEKLVCISDWSWYQHVHVIEKGFGTWVCILMRVFLAFDRAMMDERTRISLHKKAICTHSLPLSLFASFYISPFYIIILSVFSPQAPLNISRRMVLELFWKLPL